MFKKYLVKIKDLIREYGIIVLIGLFIYIAIMLTKLNNSLEIAKISINSVGRKIPTQTETVSISDMWDSVNFRHEFDYVQNKLDDLESKIDEINGTLGIVEINTR